MEDDSSVAQTEALMTPEKSQKLFVLSRQLTESLMNAALCAKEISEIANTQGSDGSHANVVINGNGHQHNGSQIHRPFLDEATLSVIWRGRTLHLGHTKGFWLLSRLVRRVNQYVTHLDLLQEIWDDEFADTERLRTGMKRLRIKLRQGGMADLAEALTGHHGRYMLDLARAKGHRKVTAMSHRTPRV
jgi:DNA-binding response OmpR family regulator